MKKTTRLDIETLLRDNIRLLQVMLGDLQGESDDLDLWTYLEDLTHVIPANLGHDAQELYAGLYPELVEDA